MLIIFPRLSLSLWVATIVCQLALVFQVRRKQKGYQAFKLYIYASAMGSLMALLVATGSSRIAYFLTYYLVALICSILALVVAWEIYRQVFGPRIALPRYVPQRAAGMTAISFSAALAIGVVTYNVTGGIWSRTMVTVEQILTVANWASFVMLAIYSRSLHIPWRKRTAQIWLGFVLFLSVNMIAVFVRSLAGMSGALIAGQVGQCAYLLSLFWWLWCLWEKELEPVAATETEIKQILGWHKETIEFLRGHAQGPGMR